MHTNSEDPLRNEQRNIVTYRSQIEPTFNRVVLYGRKEKLLKKKVI